MTEFKSKIGNAGCHTLNIGELLLQVDNQIVVVDGNVVKIPVEKIPLLLGAAWSKLKETFRECEGKELVIDFGDTASANMLETILKFILELLPNATVKNPA